MTYKYNISVYCIKLYRELAIIKIRNIEYFKDEVQ